MVTAIINFLTGIIVNVISQSGYAGVALLMAIESAAIPLPSEIIMPFAGYLAGEGRFTLWGLALAEARSRQVKDCRQLRLDGSVEQVHGVQPFGHGLVRRVFGLNGRDRMQAADLGEALGCDHGSARDEFDQFPDAKRCQRQYDHERGEVKPDRPPRVIRQDYHDTALMLG